MSNEAADLADAFSEWNPMSEDYLNSEFNLYDYGPGAGLDLALQPAQLAKEETLKTQPYLVFKKLPRNMTEKSLKSLCQRHGTVQRMYECQKTSRTFAYFYNVSDMDAVYRALKENDYGFQVEVGRKVLHNKHIDDEVEKTSSLAFPSRTPSEINMEDRTVFISGKKPPRPQLTTTVNDFFENFNESDCAISKNDPFQHCVKQLDSHELERAGVNEKDSIKQAAEDEYQFRTGRAFYNMPAKTKQFVKAKHEQSMNGAYNECLEKYTVKKSSKGKALMMRCIVCNSPADISCYRCGVQFYIYCGKKCQNKDWENHRKVCGKSKENQNILNESSNSSRKSENSLNQKSKSSTASSSAASSASSPNGGTAKKMFPVPKMPPNNSMVVLTAFHSPNMVFIRSKENKENAKFFKIINQLQAASSKLKQLDTLPHEGQAVIAKFERNHEYGRALVLKVRDHDSIRINFLDYGNVEIVKLSELYEMPEHLMLLPRFAVPVILKNVPKCHMTNEIRSLMNAYLRDIGLIIKYSNDDLSAENIYQVDLYDASSHQNFNKTISVICEPHEPINNDEIVTIEKLKYMPMPVGDDIELVILDNSQIHVGCISCTTKLYHMEIEGFQKDVQNYANNLEEKCYAPRQDELCIAKYSQDKQWYRGRCIEKVGDGRPLILFLDYGNLDFVNVKDIRPYPPEFNWGIFTADFGIAGLPEEEKLSVELVKRLEELFPVGNVIQAENVEYFEGNYYRLQMDSALKILADEGLLK